MASDGQAPAVASVAVTSEFTRPLHTTAWACRPEASPAMSAADLVSDRANRWNAEGQPTIYLSGDPALALVESGRHPDDLEERSRLLEVDLRLQRSIDLRDRKVRAALGLPDDVGWVLDRERAREVAESLRRSGGCEGLVVPSAGALDQPDRWNAVVFADDQGTLERLVGTPRQAGEVLVSDRAR